MVNCGTLEFESYVWSDGFGTADPQHKENSRKELFSARKRRVVQIMNTLPIEPIVKQAVDAVWNEADDIMSLRNVVAHNPILVQYNGTEEKPEWFTRVIDAKTMGAGNLTEYIDTMTDRANDLNKRLFNLRHVIGGGQIKLNYTP